MRSYDGSWIAIKLRFVLSAEAKEPVKSIAEHACFAPVATLIGRRLGHLIISVMEDAFAALRAFLRIRGVAVRRS